MQGKLVTVFGASGFLGRNIVRKLAERGARVKAACRSPEKAKFLRAMGEVGQVTPIKANVIEEDSVRAAIAGSDYVINTVGILFESGRNRFDPVQAWGAGHIGELCAEAGVDGLVHISAIGADANSTSAYARTKAKGEADLLAAFPTATILRPSIIFGPDDSFFNRFASLAGFTPVLPLVGGGKTRFQPVYVDDVAEAAVRSLGNSAAAGKTYELGGPNTYTFKELMQLTLSEIERDRMLMDIPFWGATIKATFLELLPNPMLTRDQVKLLKSDNVVSVGAPGLKDLGIEAMSCETILPTYLDKYRPGGSYNRFRITQ